MLTIKRHLTLALLLNIFVWSIHAQDSISIDSTGEFCIDIDGNTYKTIQIGEQTWMAENLKTTHYPDGSTIIMIRKNSDWKRLSPFSPVYCWFNNDSLNYANIYGALYTWAAATHGEKSMQENPGIIQGICPDGWHLPSDKEWKELEMYMGMSQADADYIKKRGLNEGSKLSENSDLWKNGPLKSDPEFGTSGFAALPGSFRYDFGQFYSIGYYSSYWSSTDLNPNLAWYRSITYSDGGVYRYTLNKKHGLSVRCIKDK